MRCYLISNIITLFKRENKINFLKHILCFWDNFLFLSTCSLNFNGAKMDGFQTVCVNGDSSVFLKNKLFYQIWIKTSWVKPRLFKQSSLLTFGWQHVNVCFGFYSGIMRWVGIAAVGSVAMGCSFCLPAQVFRIACPWTLNWFWASPSVVQWSHICLWVSVLDRVGFWELALHCVLATPYED